MKDLHLTSPKGMNDTKKRTMEAKDTGQQTGGADMSKGYKTLADNVGRSPQAVAMNRGQKRVNDND